MQEANISTEYSLPVDVYIHLMREPGFVSKNAEYSRAHVYSTDAVVTR